MAVMIDDVARVAVWFKELGNCYRGCGRKATGQLMNRRNENVGSFCSKCADQILKRRKKLKTEELA